MELALSGDTSGAAGEHAAAVATLLTAVVETSIKSNELEGMLQAAYIADPDWITTLSDANLYCIQGLWYKGPLLVVPRSLQKFVFDEHHATIIAGHLGRDKTHAAISAVCWWPTLYADPSLAEP